MSVVAYCGLPGSGKSYGVVQNVICTAIEAGRVVHTNIPLRLDAIEKRYPGKSELIRVFSVDDFLKEEYFQSWTPGVLVLDEAWRVFPAGKTASSIEQYHKSFFAEHRHMVDSEGRESDIVLVTQDLGQLSTFITLLVETVYVSVKLTAVGLNNHFRVDVYAGRKIAKSNLIRSEQYKYDKSVFELYKSHTKSSSAGKRAKVDKRETIFGTAFRFRVGFVLLVLGVVGFYGRSALDRIYDLDPVSDPGLPVAEASSSDGLVSSPSFRSSPAASSVPVVSLPVLTPFQAWLFSGDVKASVAFNAPGRELLSLDGNYYDRQVLEARGIVLDQVSTCHVILTTMEAGDKGPVRHVTCPDTTDQPDYQLAGGMESVGGYVAHAVGGAPGAAVASAVSASEQGSGGAPDLPAVAAGPG